jgi:hypothetical protein
MKNDSLNLPASQNRGDDMAKFMAKSDAEMGVTMKAVGLVK